MPVRVPAGVATAVATPLVWEAATRRGVKAVVSRGLVWTVGETAAMPLPAAKVPPYWAGCHWPSSAAGTGAGAACMVPRKMKTEVRRDDGSIMLIVGRRSW